MYLWDANILRAFGQGHATLRSYLLRVPWSEIALPSVVVAEVLRGRCDFALKATPAEAPFAHQRLLNTQQMLSQFQIVVFDAACVTVMEDLRQRHRRRKRYPDLMIAAIVAAGQHVLVTRNQGDFSDVLPRA
jgi:predicted nucleic acid-binding protein